MSRDAFSKPDDEGEENVLDAMYGKTGVQASGKRLRIPHIPIQHIYPDVTQPRHIVPREVRAKWSGEPTEMHLLFEYWLELILQAQYEIPVVDIIHGKEEIGAYLDTGSPLVDKFTKVLSLAAQIYKSGLLMPIGIFQRAKDNYLLVFGERRWTAFQLLEWLFADEEFSQIPAQIKKGTAFELAQMQAAENGQQAGLNAISKARQFAKLLMDAGNDPTRYDEWSTLVVPGTCDRPYFAQVADGENHRIPRGMGTQFEQSMGISKHQIRQYRKLLSLTGDYELDNTLWDLGDENNWTENFMREMVQNLEVQTIREIFHTVTTRNGIDDSTPEKMLRQAIAEAKKAKEETKEPPPPAPSQSVKEGGVVLPASQLKRLEERYLNQRVKIGSHDGRIETVVEVLEDGRLLLGYGRVVTEAETFSVIHEPTGADEIQVGTLVQTRNGRQGEVVTINGRDIGVLTANGVVNQHREHLTVIEAPSESEVYQLKLTYLSETILLDGKIVGSISKVFPTGKMLFRPADGGEDSIVSEHRIALHSDDMSDEPEYQIGDYVSVRKGMSQFVGTVRYIKDGKYGVYLNKSASTHYYEAWQLSYIGSLLDQRVQSTSGVTGTVRLEDGDNIRVLRDDNGNTLYTERSHIVAILEDENRNDESPSPTNAEDDEALDKGHSPTPLNKASATYWLARAAYIERDGERINCIAQNIHGPDTVIAIMQDGQRVQVHISELHAHDDDDTGNTRLTEFFEDDTEDAEPSVVTGPVLSDTGDDETTLPSVSPPAIDFGANSRVIFGALSGIAIAIDDPEVSKILQEINDMKMRQVNEFSPGDLSIFLGDVDVAIDKVIEYIRDETGRALEKIVEAHDG